MRILLVQSWLGREQPPAVPLGLACLASAWRDGNEVRILDPNLVRAPGKPLDALADCVRDTLPDLTGLSVRNLDTTQRRDRFSYLPALLAQLRLLEVTAPGVPVVLGGTGFSLFADLLSGRLPGVAAGVMGEAELVSPERLLERIGREQGQPPPIITSGKGRFVRPAWGAVDLAAYARFQDNLAVGVEVSRGCDGSCTYCAYPSLGGSVVRTRPIDGVLEDLHHLHDRGGIDHFFLVPALVNAVPDHARELLEAIRDHGPRITWEGYHSAVGLDRDYVALARESGCTGMSISPDSGTDRGMSRLGKREITGDVEHALQAIAEAGDGIRVSLNLFPLVPGGGMIDALRTFRRGRAWGRLCGEKLQRLRFGTIRVLPSTPLCLEHRAGRAESRETSLLPEGDRIPDRCFWPSAGRVVHGLLEDLDRLLGKRLEQ